jgi:hypothetical protein
MAKKKAVKAAKTKVSVKKVVEKKPKVKRVKCEECGAEYDAGASHAMFCSAHTCTQCGTSYGYPLNVTGEDAEGNEERVCQKCEDENEEEENEEESES